MPSLEAVCGRLFGQPDGSRRHCWRILSLSGLNVFALGYLIEYAQRLRRLGDSELPEWRIEFQALFIEGLRAFVVLCLVLEFLC